MNTIFPVSNSQSAVQSAAGSQATLSNEDFTRILLAQMAQPDLSGLFGSSDDDDNSSSYLSSVFGGSGQSSSSLLASQYLDNSGAQSLLASQMLGTGASSMTPAMQLSIWSNLIGKEIEAADSRTGGVLSGRVSSVVLENGVAMLDIGSDLVDPSSVVKVK